MLWRIRLLGSLGVIGDSYSTDRFDTQRAAKLLALLALSRTGRMSRNEVADLLWPDDFPDATRLRLRQELSRLRRALGPAAEILLTDPSVVGLDRGKCETDLDVLRRSSILDPQSPKRPELLREAATIAAGEFLPGWEDDWVRAERTSVDALRVQALVAQAEACWAANDPKAAVDCAKKATLIDPVHEPARMIAIRAHAALGGLANALAEFQQMKRVLREQEGRDPSVEAHELIDRVRSGGIEPSTPVEAAHVRWRTLPHPIDRFFGRQSEIAQLEQLLMEPGCRLLVIAGPGGIGKTRLSLEVARRARANFPGGVAFISLADIGSQGKIAEAILQQNQITLPPGIDADSYLKRLVPAEPTILVLDNMEHLLPGAIEQIQALLHENESLRLLITSRVVLRVAGERVLTLGPLPVETDGKEMLLDLWRSIRVGITLTPAMEQSATELVSRLDGFPLALRLAGSHLKLRNPGDILSEMAAQPNLAAARGTADLPQRHQSMGQALSWSFNLLPPAARQALLRISFFRGGCSLRTAQRLIGVDTSISVLEDLVDASLLVIEEGEQLRFRMQELVREHAAAVAEVEERESARDAFLSTILEWIEAEIPAIWSPVSRQLVAALDLESENLKAALEIAEAEDHEKFVELNRKVWVHDLLRGRHREVSRRLNLALSMPNLSPMVRGELKFGLGQVQNGVAQERVAMTYLEDARAEFEAAGDATAELQVRAHIGFALRRAVGLPEALAYLEDALSKSIKANLGPARFRLESTLAAVSHATGDLKRRVELLQSAYAGFRAMGHDSALVHVGQHLGATLFEAGDYAGSRKVFAEIEAMLVEVDDLQVRAYQHELNGHIALAEGRPALAEIEFRRSLERWELIRNEYQIADQYVSLSQSLLLLGRIDEAEDSLRRAVEHWPEQMDVGTLLLALPVLARAQFERGDTDAARISLGFMHSVGETIGLQRPLSRRHPQGVEELVPKPWTVPAASADVVQEALNCLVTWLAVRQPG